MIPSHQLKQMKRRLRREVLALRDALRETDRAACGRAIAERLLALPELQGVRTVLAFSSFGSEVDTAPIAEGLRARGARVALPRIEDDRLVPVAYRPVTMGTAGALYALGSEHLEHIWLSGKSPDVYLEQTEYPIEAVRWIRSHRQDAGARLYNDYGYGGFLLWYLPGEKIFIDGRMPAWRIGGRNIFQDYADLNREDSPQLAVLDRYAIGR